MFELFCWKAAISSVFSFPKFLKMSFKCVSETFDDLISGFLTSGHKKVVLFPEIGRVKFFYHSPVRIVECVSECTFLIKKTPKNQE